MNRPFTGAALLASALLIVPSLALAQANPPDIPAIGHTIGFNDWIGTGLASILTAIGALIGNAARRYLSEAAALKVQERLDVLLPRLLDQAIALEAKTISKLGLDKARGAIIEEAVDLFNRGAKGLKKKTGWSDDQIAAAFKGRLSAALAAALDRANALTPAMSAPAAPASSDDLTAVNERLVEELAAARRDLAARDAQLASITAAVSNSPKGATP